MTNETGLHENGAADEVATIAAITAETSEAIPTTEATAAEPEVPAEPKPPSFDDLGLHPDVKLALDDMGYFAPTAVQTAVFKPVSENKDLLVQSKTGTGKTTAFGLPLINRLVPTHRAPQALILAPTRELALQVARELTQVGKHRGILVEAIYGGAPIGKQIKALRDGVHIVVGTPGRVLDHIGRRTLDCKTISTFVLDECDEMLSMGFLEDIERVVSNLPDKKQTLLFSATMPDEVQRYARRHMVAPEQISLSRDSISVTDIHHAYYIVSGIARSRDLLKIIYAEEPDSAIIFCNMRDETTMVAKVLQKQGLDAEPLSSDLSQSDRERVMARMKQKNLRFLVATDVAARGIDITDLSHVINFSVPESPEVYVHRTGRTGRAGKKGTALSMVGPRELGNFRYVRLQFGIKPEERVLPKDTVFVGKLKVPLPPVGVPQPPDPIQILIRGVTATANDLERQIFEKMLTSASGKRVLAALVAEKLDKLSTRSKPKRERPPREEGAPPHSGPEEAAPAAGGEERSFDRDRERRPYGDRDRGGDRGDRPRFDRDRGGGGGGDRGDRPRFDRDRGAPGAEGGGGGGDRGDRPRFDRDRGGDRDRGAPGAEGGERKFDRDRGDRDHRGDRDRGAGPGAEGGEPRKFDRDRGGAPGADGGERKFDRDRGDRDHRGDRDRGERRPFGDRDRGDRPRFDRDRDRNREHTPPTPAGEGDAPAVTVVPTEGTAAADVTVEARPVEARQERHDRDRDRGGGDRDRDRNRGGRDRDRGGDRGERRFDRDRDRGGDRDRGDRGGERPNRPEPRDTVMDPENTITERVEAVTEVGTEAAPIVEVDEAGMKVDDVARAALERKSKRDAKRTAPTEETREFWETWADDKATRPAAEPAEAKADDDEDEPAAEARPSRDKKPASRDKGGRDKGRDKGRGRDKKETKSEKPEGRAKRDTVLAPAPVMEGAQARLFVTLGKKHGVTADDLRELLAAAVGGDKTRIGSVSLRDSHAHVRVPEELADKIIEGVNGTTHNEHDVTVERARA